MRIIVTGGGTGGHLYPALTIAEALRERVGQSLELLYVGSRRGIERQVLPSRDWPSAAYVLASPLPARRSLRTLTAMGTLSIGCLQSWALLRRFRPAVVFGTGGYASACVVQAATMVGVKTVIHDSDAVPGRTSRRLAKGATRVTVGYASAAEALARPDAMHTGSPLRPEIGTATHQQGLETLDLSPDRRTLLVQGGSQGARSLNDAVAAASPTLIREFGLQILHVTGRDREPEVLAATASHPADVRAAHRLVPYLEGTMHLALAAADLALCRTGAGTVSEVTAVGLPAIYVPYPHAMSGHQRANVEHVIEAGGGVLIEDAALSGEVLCAGIADMLKGDRLVAMAEAARGCGRPGATEKIVDIILEVAQAS